MIIAAAVQLDSKDIFIGKNHGEALANAKAIMKTDSCVVVKSGFLTSRLKILDKKEAFIYAQKHNQLKENVNQDIGELVSAYLW
jgi:hypothetical protein